MSETSEQRTGIPVAEILSRDVTFFSSATDKRPWHRPLSEALLRIKSGRSASSVEAVRSCSDEEERKKLKLKLPSVIFSGSFDGREDVDLKQHSGLIVLDWDSVQDTFKKSPQKLRDELKKDAFLLAAWVSPSGDGVKALALVAFPERHRSHFEYLFSKKYRSKIDPSGVNPARLCFESYDPDMWVRDGDVVPLTLMAEKAERRSNFDRLVEWMTSQRNAFVKGERNTFVFKLASACCRVGITQSECEQQIMTRFVNGTDFGQTETLRTIASAYRCNTPGSAEMSEDDTLVTVDGATGEVISLSDLERDMPPKDIITLSDCESDMDNIFEKGWTRAETTYFEQLDFHWRWKRGDLNVIHGMPNMGKSTFYLFLCLIKAVKEGRRYCIFGPETFPAHNFYLDMIESYLGGEVAGGKYVSKAEYAAAKRFIERHFYYIYPMDNNPTPGYIKERFFEMIVKEKIDGCIIDPWNQLDHSFGDREDQYLSRYLGEFSRFFKENDVYGAIIAHPHKMMKDGSKDYPCPTMYNLAGGAMWGNKADNLCAFHRPTFYSEPDDPTCEWHSQKIKRQKEVGKRGTVRFTYDYRTRRFYDALGDCPLGRRMPVRVEDPRQETAPAYKGLSASTTFDAGAIAKGFQNFENTTEEDGQHIGYGEEPPF
jgi:hypothetical protein